MLWLLASEHIEGVIDADPEELAFRLRMAVSEVQEALGPLIGKGFFVVVQFASTALAPQERLASPETERETEGETEGETPLVRLAPDVAQAKKRKAQIKTEALQYLEFLNAKAGKHFRPVPSNLRFIEARLGEGVPLQDLKTLTVRKCREWLGTDQEKYLRPETLCNATKCHSYLGEIPPEDQTCNVPDATEASGLELSPAHAAGRPPTTLPPRPSSPTAGAAAGLQESSNATIPEPSATGPKAMAHFIADITSSAAIPSPDSGLSRSPETGSGEPPSPSGLSLH
jgi:uncharacterized phage protein (TIGR02220 family)